MYMRNVTPKKISFSKIEIDHLMKSWIAISIAFAIAMAGFNILSVNFYTVLLISLFTVGTGFLIHELSHKFTAQYFRCYAEYRANFQMLFLAILMSFMGVIFAAPGAVMISGHLNRKERGIISLSGPLSNIVLAFIFLMIGIFAGSGILNVVALYGFSINAWLALFNLIPFAMFDGKKIFQWDKKIYFIVVGVFLVIRISGGIVLGIGL